MKSIRGLPRPCKISLIEFTSPRVLILTNDDCWIICRSNTGEEYDLLDPDKQVVFEDCQLGFIFENIVDFMEGAEEVAWNILVEPNRFSKFEIESINRILKRDRLQPFWWG
jgi:hypothetical protein